MANRRVAVVGGSGFIGRYVVKRLAATGAVVVVIGRDPEKAKFLRTMGDVGQVAPVRVGLADEAGLAAAVAGCEVVVSLAGILYESGAQTFQAVHVDGPARLARIAAAAGVAQLVHVSAIGADPGSASLYARSKAAGEAAVRAAFPAATILRPSVVFGAEDDFFNRFAAMARVSPFLPLIGGGTTRFQPVYVADVADAVMAALSRPDAAGKTYELGGPTIYTFRQLMELVLQRTGRHCVLLDLPFGIARLQASLFELLPKPMLTRDQLELLKVDNVVAADAAGLADLGIKATAVEAIVPIYLDRYRRGGGSEAHGMPA